MTVYDLLFIVSFFVTAGALVRIPYLLLRRRRTAVAATATRIGIFVAAYATVLIAVSVLSPGRIVPIGEARCFDEWCITVTSAERTPRIGDVPATGTFEVVTTRVSSRSRGRRQREIDVYPFLIDGSGRRFDVSPTGQEALRRAGLAGEPLTSFVDPGDSFDSRLAFDLPPDAKELGFVKAAHGSFPRLFIINESGSLLHRPTVVPL